MDRLIKSFRIDFTYASSSLSSRLKKKLYRLYSIQCNHIIEIKNVSKNFSRRSLDSFLRETSETRERERKKRISIIFLYILPHSLLEKKEGGVSSRVDTGNIRNEMEISSGGGDKGEEEGE